MPERGDIKNLARYKQLFSYSGLTRRRNITPTDIDGVLDYNNNAFIFLEAKLINKEVDFGQRKALEGIIKSLHESGRPSCCLVFRHNSSSNEIIIVDKCIVSEIFYQGKWKSYSDNRTVLQCVIHFEKEWEKLNIHL
jgi:hypothetical protein